MNVAPWAKAFFRDVYVDLVLLIGLAGFTAVTAIRDVWFATGFGIAAVATFGWLTARAQLGEAFTVMPSAKRLVTTGLYSRIRHPIYLFSLLALLGIAIALQALWLFALWVAIALMQWLRMRAEDATLRRHFGPAYDDYARRTWM
jgi:protein-S-isoprenylcysteine O-methyltransferase Ste14